MNKSLASIVPMDYQLSKPGLLGKTLSLQFGVLIGFTGALRGKLILAADLSVFASVGEAMFGMVVEGEMLTSFSGEFGNMLAGNLSTTIGDNGMVIDITAPTIMQGNTRLSGYDKAIHLTASLINTGDLDIYLLLDQ